MNQPMTHTKVSSPSTITSVKPETDFKNRLLLYGGIAVAALIVAYVGYHFWTRKPVPRLNAKIEEIVRYVEDTGFRGLPVERQFVYLKALDDRPDDMKAAFEKKKITADEYSAAKEYAWFGKQLSNMERYVALRNPGERQKLLDKLIDKKINKSIPKKLDPNKTPAPPSADDDDEPPVTRDLALEKVLPLTWPRETRNQWEQYRKALRDRERERLAGTRGSATTKKSGE